MRLLNILGATMVFLFCILLYFIFWLPNKILELIDVCIVKGLFASISIITGESDRLSVEIEEVHEEEDHEV